MKEDNVNIEVVSEFKLLGTWITNDLKWDKNTQCLVKRAYGRMQLLHRAAHFTKSKNDLKSIFKSYIRPVLEQSATVWHSSITEENSKDLCRVQKAAVRIIMGPDFVSYSHGLIPSPTAISSPGGYEVYRLALNIPKSPKSSQLPATRT